MTIQRALALQVEYDEHMHRMSPSETEVDRVMQKQASQIPSSDHTPITEYRERAEVFSEHIFQDQHGPDINRRHRPDLERMMSGRDDTTGEKCAKFGQGEYSLPYINLEDLLQPKNFLMLLNSRGRHDPDEFAYSDLELAPLFKLRKEFLALRKESVTMAFIGRKSAQSYEQFIEWKDDFAAIESMKAGRTVHVEHGMQILIIQESVWRFLANCLRILLVDVFKDGVPLDLEPQLEPPPLTSNNDSLTCLDIISREAPYQLPSKLDIPRLQAPASAQKDHAVDHAISLREDPGYFVEMTERYRSHRPHFLLDQYGCSHPMPKVLQVTAKRRGRWQPMRTVLFSSGMNFKSASPSSKIIHRKAMAETRYFLEKISLDLIDVLKAAFRSSSPLRSCHYREDVGDGTMNMCRVMISSNIDTKDEVLMHVLMLIQIFGDKGTREFVSLHSILDEFEHLMQDEPRAKTLITQHVASTLSQLSVMSECLHHLHLFQPWARKVENMIEDNRARYLGGYEVVIRPWDVINKVAEKFVDPKLFKLGNPKDGKFDYPAEKRCTRETVKAMIAAEAALDAFWRAANAHWVRYTGTTPVALVKHVIGDRVLHRTPFWIEPATSPPSEQEDISTYTKSDPFFGHAHDMSKQITGNFKKLEISAKEKQKTRGLIAKEHNVTTVLNDQPEVTSSKPIIAVDKRAAKVFNSLFHSPDSPNQPGEVAWPDFLHAMVKAGFGAEKLQGSAWHFTPHNLRCRRIDPVPRASSGQQVAFHLGSSLQPSAS
ncbi:hypothetical protein EK21DRAFT_112377 [Setomelanomma holmii]|uniref:Uncharacterized protein n=1 Tax=Setomelanomma holmii TaxID=210430 RepID=A0A9P4LNG5_9PLEO|nr:hypothetical protein EK21DRAFT_112377 [Setomelanomma holmii]